MTKKKFNNFVLHVSLYRNFEDNLILSVAKTKNGAKESYREFPDTYVLDFSHGGATFIFQDTPFFVMLHTAVEAPLKREDFEEMKLLIAEILFHHMMLGEDIYIGEDENLEGYEIA